MPLTNLSFQKNINLAPYNTLGIPSRASRFIAISDATQLQELIRSWEGTPPKNFILGGGSNVLFVNDFDGLIIHVDIRGRELIDETDTQVLISLGAGENWHESVMYCVGKGWGGIENLSLIPGTVGAAPIQNIGAYGVELEQVFERLEAVNLKTGELKTFTKEECRFSYRDSIFKNELKGEVLVTKVVLRLSKQPTLNTSYGAIQEKLEEHGIARPTIKDISDIVIDIRNSKLPDPADLGNAGSFFKNPVVSRQKFEQLKNNHPEAPGYELNEIEVKVPAGWLIEKTGWKGKVLGNAGTYKQQALVIVNHGGATGEEILHLAGKIKESVKDTFGIDLVPEVNIVS
ncbi:MAG: UDP-N-acetylmuramate dehydrogenase [Balneolaceae bacterium]|nr:UDP-N-acetylmuramate dehydrogenase [Balneolaceae bacterium]